MPPTARRRFNRVTRALIAAGCVALIGFVVVVVGAVYGLANSGGDPHHPGTPNSTVEVTFAPNGQATRTTSVELLTVDCYYFTTQVSVQGTSARGQGTFAGVGTPKQLNVSLQFGDFFFLAADPVSLKNDVLDVKDVEGHVNSWFDDAPGPVVAVGATLSGKVTCTSVEH